MEDKKEREQKDDCPEGVVDTYLDLCSTLNTLIPDKKNLSPILTKNLPYLKEESLSYSPTPLDLYTPTSPGAYVPTSPGAYVPTSPGTYVPDSSEHVKQSKSNIDTSIGSFVPNDFIGDDEYTPIEYNNNKTPIVWTADGSMIPKYNNQPSDESFNNQHSYYNNNNDYEPFDNVPKQTFKHSRSNYVHPSRMNRNHHNNRTNRNHNRPPPNYSCHICGSGDHYIKNCPRRTGRNTGEKRSRRDTGRNYDSPSEYNPYNPQHNNNVIKDYSTGNHENNIFSSEIQHNFTLCGVCHNRMIEPQYVQCCHTNYCKKCISNVVKQLSTCPCCQSPIDKRDVFDNIRLCIAIDSK